MIAALTTWKASVEKSLARADYGTPLPEPVSKTKRKKK
jgi:hypothetical protein